MEKNHLSEIPQKCLFLGQCLLASQKALRPLVSFFTQSLGKNRMEYEYVLMKCCVLMYHQSTGTTELCSKSTLKPLEQYTLFCEFNINNIRVYFKQM